MKDQWKIHSLFNCQGFTLIELIIALGLTVTVLGLIGTFFIGNYRAFHEARDLDLLMGEVSTVTQALNKALMESEGVVSIQKQEENYYALTLRGVDGVTETTFSFSGGRITQKIGSEATVILTESAERFNILPVQSEVLTVPVYLSDTLNSFTATETRGIEYTFVLKRGNLTKEVQNQVTFRNKN